MGVLPESPDHRHTEPDHEYAGAKPQHIDEWLFQGLDDDPIFLTGIDAHRKFVDVRVNVKQGYFYPQLTHLFLIRNIGSA